VKKVAFNLPHGSDADRDRGRGGRWRKSPSFAERGIEPSDQCRNLSGEVDETDRRLHRSQEPYECCETFALHVDEQR